MNHFKKLVSESKQLEVFEVERLLIGFLADKGFKADVEKHENFFNIFISGYLVKSAEGNVEDKEKRVPVKQLLSYFNSLGVSESANIHKTKFGYTIEMLPESDKLMEATRQFTKGDIVYAHNHKDQEGKIIKVGGSPVKDKQYKVSWFGAGYSEWYSADELAFIRHEAHNETTQAGDAGVGTVVSYPQDSDEEEPFICSLCEKPSFGYGNDPWPLAKKVGDRCCDVCNVEHVIPARIAMISKSKVNESADRNSVEHSASNVALDPKFIWLFSVLDESGQDIEEGIENIQDAIDKLINDNGTYLIAFPYVDPKPGDSSVEIVFADNPGPVVIYNKEEASMDKKELERPTTERQPKTDEMEESVAVEARKAINTESKFLVIQKGGSIDSIHSAKEQGYYYQKGGVQGIIVKGFNDKDKAKEFAKRMRRTLSPGEKEYYGIGYSVVSNPMEESVTVEARKARPEDVKAEEMINKVFDYLKKHRASFSDKQFENITTSATYLVKAIRIIQKREDPFEGKYESKAEKTNVEVSQDFFVERYGRWWFTVFDKNNEPVLLESGKPILFRNKKEANDWVNNKTISEDRLNGGLADDLSIINIAEKHGVSVESIEEQLIKGVEVEMEHTNDAEIAYEIALDHLVEFPDYYDKLAKMEESSNNMITVELDIAPMAENEQYNNDNIEEDLANWKAYMTHNWPEITLELLELNGPYGWPVYNLTGNRSVIENYLWTDYLGLDGAPDKDSEDWEDIQMLIGQDEETSKPYEESVITEDSTDEKLNSYKVWVKLKNSNNNKEEKKYNYVFDVKNAAEAKEKTLEKAKRVAPGDNWSAEISDDMIELLSPEDAEKIKAEVTK